MIKNLTSAGFPLGLAKVDAINDRVPSLLALFNSRWKDIDTTDRDLDVEAFAPRAGDALDATPAKKGAAQALVLALPLGASSAVAVRPAALNVQ